MSAADRVYGLLLRAYPRAFRAGFGREMRLVFADRRREAEAAGRGGAPFWTEILLDVARSAPVLRLEAMRARGSDTHTGAWTMKTMAILTILIGAFEAANAAAEGTAGGFASGNGLHVGGVLLMILVGVLLLAAGVALLRRAPSAASWARGAAIACLAAVLLVKLAFGWMSMFSILLGVAFPLALLLVVRPSRGTPTAA